MSNFFLHVWLMKLIFFYMFTEHKSLFFSQSLGSTIVLRSSHSFLQIWLRSGTSGQGDWHTWAGEGEGCSEVD